MTTLGSLLYGLKTEPFHGHGITAAGQLLPVEDGAHMSFEHSACSMSEFCRNPLHPGPCKGWKKTLGKIAPGALTAIEKAQKEKTAARRAARAEAKSAAEKKVAGNALSHPLTAKKQTIKHANILLGDAPEKAQGKAGKVILNKQEIKRYSKLKAAQVAALAVGHGLTSDEKKYAAFMEGRLAEALAKDNQEGTEVNYRNAVAGVAQALASPLADKFCGVGTKDGDCDGVLWESLRTRAEGVLEKALITGNPDDLNDLEVKLKELGDDREKLGAYLKSVGVDPAKVKKAMDDEAEPEPEPEASPFEKGEKTKMDKLAQTAEAQDKANGAVAAISLLGSMTSGKKLSPAQEMAAQKQIMDAQAAGNMGVYMKQAAIGLANVAGKTKSYTGVELNAADMSKLEQEFKGALETGAPTPLLNAIKKSWSAEADEFGAPTKNVAAIEALKKALGKEGDTGPSPTAAGAPGAAFVAKVAKQAGLKVDAVKTAKHQELIAQKLADGDDAWFHAEAEKLAGAVITGAENEHAIKFSPAQQAGLKAALAVELAPGIKGEKVNAPITEALDKGDASAALDAAGVGGIDLSTEELSGGFEVSDALTDKVSNEKLIDTLAKHPEQWEKLSQAEQQEVAGKLYTELMLGNLAVAVKAQNLIDQHNIPKPVVADKNVPTVELAPGMVVADLTPEAVEAGLVADKIKSATAKKKLEIYGALADKGGFENMSPWTQKKVLNDLDAMYDKFKDPKKKAETSTIISTLQAQAGGGAGAGGKGDSTSPVVVPTPSTPVTPAPVTPEEKGKVAGETVKEINELIGNTKYTISGHDGTVLVLQGIHKGGVNPGSQGDLALDAIAGAYADTALNDGTLQLMAGDKAKLKPALAADIKTKLAASGAPTPVYDKWVEAQVAQNTGAPEVHGALVEFVQAGEQWLAGNTTGMAPTSAPKTISELAKEYSDTFDALNKVAQPGKTSAPGFMQTTIESALNAKGAGNFADPASGAGANIASGLAGLHYDSAFKALGLPSAVVGDWVNSGFSFKLEDALAEDYALALLNLKPVPGGLAGQLNGLVADVNAKGDALANASGWASDAPALAKWKQVYFQSKVEEWLAANTTPKPAATPTPAPSPVAAPSAPGAPQLLGGDIWSINQPAQQVVFSAYKSLPKGTVLSASPEDQFDNLQAVAAFYSGKSIGDDFGAKYPALSVAQVAQMADAQLAKSMGVHNQNLLEKKMIAWLQTSAGKQYAQSHAPDAALVAKLDGGGAAEANAIKLKPGQKVQTVPGPGKFNAALSAVDFRPLSAEEMQASQQAYFDATGEWWTPEQTEALANYTTGAYHELNGYLRGENSSGDPVTSISALGAQRIKQIQAGMRPLQQHTSLKRGTGWEFLPPEYRSTAGAKKLIGKTFQDKAFVSSTVGGEGGNFGGSVLLKIEAPKGTPAAWVRDVSYNSGENEVVLAAGTKFRILEVEDTGYGVTEIRVRVVS